MQLITRGIEQTATAGTIEEIGFVGKLRDVLLAVAARRHTRRIVQGLSEGQLRDSGIDRGSRRPTGDRNRCVSRHLPRFTPLKHRYAPNQPRKTAMTKACWIATSLIR